MRKAFKLVLFTGVLLFFSSVTLAASIVRDLNFSDYKGKWVVISYWATWCEYCRGEIPELNSFYSAHSNQVAMFGFNYDDPGNLSDHVEDMHVNFPTLMNDPKASFGIQGISGLPTTFVIGPDGRLKHVLEGPQTKRSLERAVGL
jgi:thiol-disulfide isomerase/thioredoxin